MTRIILLFTSLFCLSAQLAPAALKVSSIFGDHMVLQRDMDVRIWGWADPDQPVSVKIDGQEVSARAGADGRCGVVKATVRLEKRMPRA